MMLKKQWLLIMCFWFSFLYAQEPESLYQNLKWIPNQDTIFLSTDHLNPSYFEIYKSDGSLLDSKSYEVDFQKQQVILKDKLVDLDTLEIRFLKFPDFLTKSYSYYDPERIVANEAGQHVYQFQKKQPNYFVPFEGLTTSGSITRGLTMGNNQNAVTNSNLDLQITGRLSDKVNLRASLQDSNVPLQNGGYSQKINEFDQIFIELFSDNWSIKAGDIFLENRSAKFLNFNKKVQGLTTKFSFENDQSKTIVEAAAALARGQYSKSIFQGQEGNQGPYKLKGPNGELFILIISGSERVYVNGILRKRGENNDYVIDYNSGEIRFTSLFPITSDMRIAIEYQYTDRNYTRFVGYGNLQHIREKWNIGGTVFTESDLKNQPIQQNLSKEQIDILKKAGNDSNNMIAPSAFLDSYSENKILYEKKIAENGNFYYEFSTNPEAELYMVYFSMVGNNNGDYILENTQSIGKIYKYTLPINGISQGNYAPVSKLIAPIKNTIATFNGSYHPSEQTQLQIEFAMSNSDQNLFSPIDDEGNKGWATEIKGKQRLWNKNQFKLDAFSNFQFVHKQFKSLENLYSIEFDRDWNLNFSQGSQSLFVAGLTATNLEKGILTYQFEKLNYGSDFSGIRNRLSGNLRTKKWISQTENSILNAESENSKTVFIRSYVDGKFHFFNNWIGSALSFENLEEKNKFTHKINPLNHQFTEWKNFVGRGDTLGVYAELGWVYRVNDSIQNDRLQKATTANTFYLKSKILQNQSSDLSVYIHHRTLNFSDKNMKKEHSLNARVAYNDSFFKGFIQTNTTYETSSGNLAQQEFTYLEVEPGLGTHTWIDYNNNGIQELEEFEIAAFPDQATFVRLYLPNQIFIQTHQKKFSQSIQLNPIAWQNENNFKKFLSHFYNQTSFLLDRSDLKNGNNFDLNPFKKDNENLIGINQNYRNNLFYNRGKQKHSITYTYIHTRSKNLLTMGTQENRLNSHQLFYNHLINKTWLLSLSAKKNKQETLSDTYKAKNYYIESSALEPKLSYLFTENTSFDFSYEFKQKENIINELGKLKQHRLGSSFQYNSKQKFTLNGEIALYKNDYTGNILSPVAYQMMEGLQAGKNITWRIMMQKNITKYLDLSLNYQGRTHKDTNTIHTGNIQLRAFF